MSKTSATSSTRTETKAFWKRFAASGTAFASRLRTDQFLRTEFAIVLLQVAFALLLLGVVWASFEYLQQDISGRFITEVVAEVGRDATLTVADAERILAGLNDTQNRSFIAIIATIILTTALFGYALARFALIPTRHAFEAQKQFVGNIAHELRTPLSIIKTNTEVALLDDRVDAQARETFEGTIEELDRISSIINNLLSLSVFTRADRIAFGNVVLNDAVRSAYDKLKPLAEKRAHHVTLTEGEDTTVWGNSTALEQIAMNLIKNALTYTPDGGTVSVTTARARSGNVELTVRDSGIGISPADLARVFEPFYKTEASRTRTVSAAGLGLTIVSELVKLHRGSITLQSEVGRGTTATVHLPHGKRRQAKQTAKTLPDGGVRIDFSRTE